jgi:hypothetical protein
MSRIPLARDIIGEVAGELRLLGLAVLARRLDDAREELHRRPLARPRAPVESRPVNARLAARMRHYALGHPDLSQQAIAEAFGVNHGRVAEVLRGDR